MTDAQATAKPVVLKKYGNRRLYDTNASRYVTLAEVEALVRDGVDIDVRDAKTGDDLTRATLVQIIAEQKDAQDALPVSFLTEVVRLGSGRARRAFADYLTSQLHTALDAQRAFAAEMQRLAPVAPTAWLNPMAMLFPPPAPGASRVPALPPVAAPVASAGDDVAALRRELSETQRLVRALAARAADEPAPPAKKTRSPRRKAPARR
jgi:polyhydroxyalkanoate synthesis repressor PhaR